MTDRRSFSGEPRRAAATNGAGERCKRLTWNLSEVTAGTCRRRGRCIVRARSDLMVFLFRCDDKGTWSTGKRRLFHGPLIGMVSGHVDDLGAGGGEDWQVWLHKQAELKFGKTRR